MTQPLSTANLQKQLDWCVKAQWVLGAFIAAMVVGFIVVCYRPNRSELGRLHARIAADRHELSANESRVTTLPAVALEVDRLRVSLENFDHRLPSTPELAEFLRNINQISRQTSLQKLSVRQESPIRLDLFSEQPIVMRFQGNFREVWSFLLQIETLPRLTRVRSLQLKSVDSKLGIVDVQLALNIYFTDG
jgi:Tfp pilus assembly protein PilO